MYRPLADEIRPSTIDEMVGQEHILGPDGMLRRIVESGNIPNMIFYGPSGTGKTTAARIIASQTNRTLRRLGLAPVAAGMILAAGATLLSVAEGGWLAWAVAAISTLLLMTTRASPFVLLPAGALVFWMVFG